MNTQTTENTQENVSRGRGRPAVYPFETLEPGQSFDVTTRFVKGDKVRNRVDVAAHLYAQRHPEFKFKTSRNRKEQKVVVTRVQ